jgi:hypothetical protein
MKRRMIQIVVLLLLGAIVNVAVACGSAIIQPWPRVWAPAFERDNSFGPGFCDWEIRVWQGAAWSRVLSRWTIGRPVTSIDELDTFGVEVLPSWARTTRPRSSDATDVLHFIEARGWPRLAMRSEWQTTGSGGIVFGVVEITSGYRVSTDRSIPWDVENPRVVPVDPIWPGFAINTIFYAAILWMLFALPLALRRRRRVKRGLCPACAYPIGTSEVCTECGAAVQP